jgi:hypothetical protein
MLLMAPITDQGASEKAKRPPNTTKAAQTASTQRNKAIGTLQRRTASENASENGPKHAKIHQSTADAKFADNVPSHHTDSTQRRGPPSSWWDMTEEEYEAAKACQIRTEQTARLQSLLDDDVKEPTTAQHQHELDAADGFQKSRKTIRSPLQRDVYPISHTTTKGRFRPLSINDDDDDDDDDDDGGDAPPNRQMPLKPMTHPPSNSNRIQHKDRREDHAVGERKNDDDVPDRKTSTKHVLNALLQWRDLFTRLNDEEPNSHEVKIGRHLFQRTYRALFLAWNHMDPDLQERQQVKDAEESGKDQDALGHVHDRINSMEKNIEEIKALLTATRHHDKARATATTATTTDTTPKTWAQIASSPERTAYAMEVAKQERRDKVTRQRIKTEVTLSLHEATKGFIEEVNNGEERYIAQIIQDEINGHWASEPTLSESGTPIRIAGVKKISRTSISILCWNSDEACVLRGFPWSRILYGAEMQRHQFGIVVHGVPKKDLNLDSPENQIAAAKAIGKVNSITNFTRAAPLIRKPKNTNAPTQSIVIYTISPAVADYVITRGIRIGDQHYPSPKRYTPECQIKQCFNCQNYGHRAEVCTKHTKCGKCAGNHRTKDCENAEGQPKCALCSGDHHAWDKSCPRREREVTWLKNRREAIPPTFDSEEEYWTRMVREGGEGEGEGEGD